MSGFADQLRQSGHILPAGEPETAADKSKQLSPAAILIAIGFAAFHNGYGQGYKKAEKPQPGEQDIEKAQDQVGKRKYPEIVIPFLFLFHHSAASNLITLAGHSTTHFPHPTQRSLSIWGLCPWEW